eukprot:INCI5280.1.p1 GENE.INCI5280.1~~INCI5280.1.p1  ORF type:complete len:273 (+),score=56.10 INCI5280.1:284-1102(+)
MDNAARQTMMEVLADVLSRLVEANDSQEQRPAITKFHALRPPSISILDYLTRILRYANCSGECFVLALVYIDRLIRHQNFVICGLNIHRVIVTSITLAAKFFDDAFYNNVYYAKIGGVPVRELNSLELEFLFLINFTLHVSPLDYYRYQKELCEHARRTGKYSEDVLPHCDVPEEELMISETDEELMSDSEAPHLPNGSDTDDVYADEPYSLPQAHSGGSASGAHRRDSSSEVPIEHGHGGGGTAFHSHDANSYYHAPDQDTKTQHRAPRAR